MQPYGRCWKTRRRLDGAPSGVEGPPPDDGEGPDRHILMWENRRLACLSDCISISKGSPHILHLLPHSNAFISTATGQKLGGRCCWRGLRCSHGTKCQHLIQMETCRVINALAWCQCSEINLQKHRKQMCICKEILHTISRESAIFQPQLQIQKSYEIFQLRQYKF